MTKMAETRSRPAEMGRVKKTSHLPPEMVSARRRFSSIIGPSTMPSSNGAISAPSRIMMKPAKPNSATIQISHTVLLVVNTPMAQNRTIDGKSQR